MQINLESIPVVGILVKGLNAILGVLKINRNVDYPTVWGRDAAVYSEPGVNNATINISNGTYSNQKDSAALGKTYLNGAVSSSATVNIIGTGNVKISNTKIGNGVDSKHNGSSTTGTLNINNPYAQLDPAVETDEDAYKAATDSWALELRGGAKVNLVAGHINDTHSQHDTKKIIESESTARINILPTEKGEATIANRQYWIDQTKADKAGFSATVNPDAHVSGSAGVANDTTENDYQLWHSAATKKDDTLAQLQELVAKETSGSDPKAAPLSTSTYTKGTISASYPDVLGQAIYGREVISSGSKIGADTIFDAVNSGTAGTVVLYGQPWTDAYNPTDVPTQGDDLFAGWYTSQTKFGEEDAIQAKPYENAADSVNNPKHHKWDPTKDGFNGTYNDTIVVDTAKYSGTLYAHFVSKDTMAVKNYQTSAATNGKSDYVNVRLIAGVDSYNFSNALFTVTLDGKLLGTAKTTTAFDYITANGAKKTVEKSPYKGTDGYEADISQGDARYVTTAIVKNVKVGSKLAVTPKWTTLDGTVVTGEQVTFTVTADDAD
ncbi:hypothetical protein [Bifidobacterium leontopitheci]|uniref:hypothetical protein n=1 Tax=Bifidobacterium leontopitheci TaxID=2650774 RepID=UPI001264BB03|nr:hypothetical protein [Bifidobacterium leontopitheci]